MAIAGRVSEYEGELRKARERQAELAAEAAQVEVTVRRLEGAILALRQIIGEEQAAASPVRAEEAT